MLIAAPVVPAPNTPIARPLFSWEKRARYRRADGEAGTDQTERQAQSQELPKCRRIGRNPERHGAANSRIEHHDPAAEPVRPNAERETKQGAGQHRRRGQQAEFGRVEANSLRIGIPMTPNIIQATKQAANAKVVTNSTTSALVRVTSRGLAMVRSFLLAVG